MAFGKSKIPALPVAQNVEPVTTVKEDAGEAARKFRRNIPQGRQGTLLAGMQSILKKRLGE
jgi:hypothetical protein